MAWRKKPGKSKRKTKTKKQKQKAHTNEMSEGEKLLALRRTQVRRSKWGPFRRKDNQAKGTKTSGDKRREKQDGLSNGEKRKAQGVANR